MTVLYQIPKSRIHVEIRFASEDPSALDMFVDEGQGASGILERVIAALDSSQDFLPMARPDGSAVIVRRDAILMLSLRDTAGGEDATYGRTTQAEVQVEMEDGRSESGTVRYMMPEDRSRLQDYLNSGLRFVCLRDGAVAHLINVAYIRRITPRQELGGSRESR